jgi:diacylglycerol kinase (ATP)
MENQFKNKTSGTILIEEFRYSIDSFKMTFKSQVFFRQEIFIAITLILLGLLIGETALQKFLLVSSVLITVIIELLNPGLQVVADRIFFENLDLARYFKEIGNVAVFVAIINLFFTWLFILFPLI